MKCKFCDIDTITITAETMAERVALRSWGGQDDGDIGALVVDYGGDQPGDQDTITSGYSVPDYAGCPDVDSAEQWVKYRSTDGDCVTLLHRDRLAP